ncbi:G protein alpha subunit [Periconia macrospinosa]|uniref:G protein alpha subunit n=1 Tax=Periconia macrospinosa TaxID=97972 RepID=A0A2V1DVZ6_9PLEO|nr:G protein alpha subunit [Periconia macrospinosa]
MGCGMSRANETEESHRNREIEDDIKRDKIAQRKQVKILLLGAGESGKSTILKQMKLIHEGGYTDEERKIHRPVVYQNTVQSMSAILVAMISWGIGFDNDVLEQYAQDIIEHSERVEGETLPEAVGKAISVLWCEPSVQECFERSREYQLNDSAKYYLDSVARISAPGYVPNNDDILRSRVKSTGFTETRFTVGDITHRVFDLGGQRTERRKWIHCFEHVKIVFYVVAISEYDQLLFEDRTVKRMEEAFELFDSICNSEWFIGTPMILFFNKIDRLKENLQVTPVEEYFPDYKGGANYDAACAYFTKRFTSLSRDDSKTLYTQFTCATDTSQIEFVFSSVNDIVLKESLESSNIV